MAYIDEATRKEINKEVEKILAETSLIAPPVNYKLIMSGEGLNCDLFTDFNPFYKEFAKKISKEEAGKVRGALLVGAKQMFIKHDGYDKRVNFAYGHELAHWRLDWHREILYVCSEFDLSFKARKQLELEANYFANRLGFMNGTFNKQLQDMTLSIENIRLLSDSFDLSVEACLRTAVEDEQRPCALIVMIPERGEAGFSLKIKYIVHSQNFEKKFGHITYDQIFSPDRPMTKIINDLELNMANYHTFESNFRSDKNHHTMNIEMWKNKFNAFALVTPKK